MGTHVTLLVHGIGEQVAGETVDEFVGAARHELKLDDAVEDNTVLLAEGEATLPQPKKGTGQLQQYPCHMRRIRQDDRDLLFAEVHWSDLSKAPKGVFATAFDLLRLVLGLGYLALDNVESNGGEGWSLIRLIVHAFVWIFFLILAPINALMFVGALGLLVEMTGLTFGGGQDDWSPLTLLFALGALLAVGTGWIAWRANTYLKRLFFSGMAILGSMCVLVAVAAPFDLKWPINEVWVPTCVAVDALKAGVPPSINCFAGVLVFCMNSIWLLEVGLFLSLCIVSLFTKTLFEVEKRSIYLAICAAMLLFWMTISVSFWSVFRSAVARLGGSGETVLLSRVIDQHIAEATATLAYVFLALLIVLCVGAAVWLMRIVSKAKFAKETSLQAKGNIKFSRLILNPSINIAMVFSSLLLVLGAFFAFAEWWLVEGRTYQWWILVPANFVVWHVGSVADYLRGFSTFALSAVGVVGVLIVNNAGFIAAALGVGRDIVIYATRSHIDPPGRSESWAFALRRRFFKNGAAKSSYVYRERIEARFIETFERVIAQEKAIDRITVVSHSQGTVVSVMGLLHLAKTGGQSAQDSIKKLNLVTMGCPIQHIYRHYFRDNYQIGEADWHDATRWTNIYRVDDFVGKTVGGDGLSVDDNAVLAAKGHSHYWSDQKVWDILKSRSIY